MTARMRVTLTGLLTILATSTAASAQDTAISVVERDGVYVVSARFTLIEPASVVRSVLTDYAGIPRFMPNVQTSRVLTRGDGTARIEQVAVSRYLMFSKQVHLVLNVEEGIDVIRFRDECGRSFAQYEGSWTMTGHGANTELYYELMARPTFSVPAFVLRKLLDRDARQMIAGLAAEAHARR